MGQVGEFGHSRSLTCPHGVRVFASVGSGGDGKWARNSEWPLSGAEGGGVSREGRSVFCILFPVMMLMLEVTGEETIPDLELCRQHLVPALPLMVCVI